MPTKPPARQPRARLKPAPKTATTKSLQVPAEPDAADRRRFRVRLLSWYRRHGRDLPWRKTDDPYHILVSEIMLQQTQVDRVLPKYGEWLARYPSMHALAAAPEDEVTAAWYPLGYNIRPRRLQSIAREAVTRYGGALPADEATLRSFKGIGAYTAGAIRSFAFRQRAAILDTNVARVLFRVFVGTGDLKSHAMRRHLWTLSEVLVPQRHVFDFNQALMDFGAMVCVARNPKCLICPMLKSCLAFRGAKDAERRTPNAERRTKNAERQAVHPQTVTTIVVAAAIVERDDDYLVTRRQPGVHLSGHWEFPGGKCQAGETLESCLARELHEELDVDAVVGAEIFTTSHDYPDRRVELHFFRCELRGRPMPQQGQDLRWVRRDALRTLQFPPADVALIDFIERLA